MTSHPAITAFTGIRLAHWKNFSSVDVSLGPRAFLVGPNASGKSNFLDAFRFLRDIVTEGGGLDHAVRLRGGTRAIRTLADQPDDPIHVGVSLVDEEETAWSYDLWFSEDSEGRTVVSQESVRRGETAVFNRPDSQDRDDPEQLRQTHLEQVSANRSFRVIAEFFESISYLHIVPHLIREPRLSSKDVSEPLGGDLLNQLARMPDSMRTRRLTRIRVALRAAVPQLKDLEYWLDGNGRPRLRGRFAESVGNDGWQTEERFSDGTLRLFGLLWAAMEGTGPLLLEEPELSLQPSVVRLIPAMLFSAQEEMRQLIVSTHSPDLLADQGIGLDEVLLLQPFAEGTRVRLLDDDPSARVLINHGVPMGEAVLPIVSAPEPYRLLLPG